MMDVIGLLKEQKKLELDHVETLSESIKDLKPPLVRVILEAIIHDSRKHAAIAQALVDVEAGIASMKMDVDMGSAVNLHQNIKQHIRVEENMFDRLVKINDLIDDDRVKAFIKYLLEEEKRHHQIFHELSNIIDRDSASVDEYLGLFQKYMIVPP